MEDNSRIHLNLAIKRVADAVGQLPMNNPQSAGISAFINVTLLNAKIDALVAYTAPYELDAEGQPIMKATFDELHLQALNETAVKLEQAARGAPRIHLASAH